MTAEEQYLLALCRAGFLHETPPAPPKGIDFNAFITLSLQHNVSALVAQGAFLLPKDALPANILAQFEQLDAQARRDEAIEYFTTSELGARFSSAGVDYCLLKGSLWRKRYPKPYLREMGDIDILIRLEHWKNACQCVLDMGFVKTEDTDLHTVFAQGDLSLELHRGLLSSRSTHQQYFFSIWDRMIQQGDSHEWRLPAVDDCLYFFLHAEKHINASVFVLRALTDLVVIFQGCSSIELEEFNVQAQKLGLTQCVHNLKSLSQAWLSNAKLSKTQEELLDYLMGLWHLTDEEMHYRVSSRWLRLNLNPCALMRKTFLSKNLLLSHCSDPEGKHAFLQSTQKVIKMYRCYLGSYRHVLPLLPRARRKTLRQQQLLLYKP